MNYLPLGLELDVEYVVNVLNERYHFNMNNNNNNMNHKIPTNQPQPQLLLQNNSTLFQQQEQPPLYDSNGIYSGNISSSVGYLNLMNGSFPNHYFNHQQQQQQQVSLVDDTTQPSSTYLINHDNNEYSSTSSSNVNEKNDMLETVSGNHETIELTRREKRIKFIDYEHSRLNSRRKKQYLTTINGCTSQSPIRVFKCYW